VIPTLGQHNVVRAVSFGVFLAFMIPTTVRAESQSVSMKELHIQYLSSLALVHHIPRSACGGYLTKLTVEPLDSAKKKVRPYLSAEEVPLLESGYVEQQAARAFVKVYENYVPKGLGNKEHKERCMMIIGYLRGRTDSLRDVLSY